MEDRIFVSKTTPDQDKSQGRVEVLVAAIDQHDDKLPDAMNIRSNALICNQCGKDGIHHTSRFGYRITYYHSSKRGVGRNRNMGILNATGEILLFADQDVRYHDDYTAVVEQTFDQYPDADMILFELERMNDPRLLRKPNRRACTRVHWYKALRYGACRIAVRRSSVLKANVFFSLLFGGGAPFAAGEDSLFVMDCLRSGLHVIAVNRSIGVIDQQSSTWFKGYNEHYFRSKGALYYALLGSAYPLLIIQYLLRNREEYKGSRRIRELISLFRQGKKDFQNYS
ncbi:MAG: glycosyltransferase [Clostridiaceae bacterium]|jgi:glycosyltransferase involved in cell wall biosynthesis|nr:glycosyltransferase [Clostridiaceae bacterium]